MIKLTRSHFVPVFGVAIAFASTSLPSLTQAQEVNPKVAGVAEREIARRQELTERANEQLARGDVLMTEKDAV
jgi:hypothetical protein